MSLDRRSALPVVLGLALLSLVTVALAGVDDDPRLSLDSLAIQYHQRRLEDPVARLQRRLASGEAKLDYAAGGLGYLPSLLKNLEIESDSQVLVFSKTSFQFPKISPASPRAIFFSDDAAVGSVQNGDVLELAGLDPKQGVVFYTLDVHPSAKPVMVRRDLCLQCHQGKADLYVPGLMVNSVFPGPDGTPAFTGLDPVSIDDRSPLENRWGGWYVSGITGSQHHMGNAVAKDPDRPTDLVEADTQNLKSLAGKFDTSRYLEPTSDVVALMTLEHQTRMTNLITRIGWDTRFAEFSGTMSDAARAQIDSEIEEMLGYMLFTDEAPLRDPIQGVSAFTRTFSQRGPRDRQGRSLRDFDLQKRMFKYPLSYMIYSEAFNSMPGYDLDRIYQRLHEILSGQDTSKAYSRLSAADRRAILEILGDTKPEFSTEATSAAH